MLRPVGVRRADDTATRIVPSTHYINQISDGIVAGRPPIADLHSPLLKSGINHLLLRGGN
jgi:hypothetical protein